MIAVVFGVIAASIKSAALLVDEALSVETQHFVDCITQNATPLTDGKVGLRVVRILEAATESLKQGGCPVQL